MEFGELAAQGSQGVMEWSFSAAWNSLGFFFFVTQPFRPFDGASGQI